MRILVVSNLFPPAVIGGYEVECAGVVEHLRREHDVRVLTSRAGAGKGADAEQGVLRELAWLGHDWKGSLRAPATSVAAARSARRAAERFDPELVYVWNGSQIPQSALRVLDGLGVPVAWRVSEHWFGRLYRSDQFMRHLRPGDRGARAVWAAGLRALNRIHPALRIDVERSAPGAVSWASEFLRERAGVPPAVRATHEEVLHPATPELERFLGVERAPDNDPLVLFAGRLEEQKGPDVAIRAVAALERDHGIRARLVLAGGGDGGPSLRALASETGVDVELPGALAPERLREYVARAHAWIVPSVWEEPAGLGTLEAALARVPVVASRIGGIPELVHDTEHALLFTPSDAGDAARALAVTLSEPAATAARVERAFAHAQGKRHGPYLEATDRFLAIATGAA